MALPIRSIVVAAGNALEFDESEIATVKFNVVNEYGNTTTGLDSATTVNASILYGGGASSADVTALTGLGMVARFEYRMGDVGNAWIAVPTNNIITINAGFTSFWLRAGLLTDAFQEPFEALTFLVSQNSQSVGLTDSWYVPYSFDITDTTASLSTITLSGPATANVNEGADATAIFNISGGALTTDTEISALMTFVGASTLDFNEDMTLQAYLGLDGTGGTVGAAVNVTATSGLATLPANALSFVLTRETKSDGNAEYFESVIISVSQTSLDGGLKDSWYLAKTLTLVDNGGAPSVQVTAVAPVAVPTGSWTTGWTPPTSGTASEGGRAVAVFNLSSALTVSDQLDARIIGVGATLGDVTGDYSDLRFETFNGTVWSNATVGLGDAVPGSGHITLPSGTTYFRLSALLTSDNKAETSESLIFAVNQTSASKNLIDSWWVQSTVKIADVSTAATTFTGAANSDHFTGTAGDDLFVIPAGSSPAVEGYYDWISGPLASGDKIDIQGGQGGAAELVVTPFDGTVLNAIFVANTLSPTESDVAILTYLSDTFLFVDTDHSGNFGPTDTFIRLVGITLTAGQLDGYLVNHAGLNATGLFGT